jgi:hypothetical protein
MIIIRGRRKIEVPNDFLDENYSFGVDRLHHIKEMSGLSHRKFCHKHGFTYAALAGWCVKRNGQKTNNPNPSARVKLAFLEANFWLKLLLQEAKKSA